MNSMDWRSTITLQFWGILPTVIAHAMWQDKRVPLHYSSGASFQRSVLSVIKFLKCTITLQFWGILPTGGAKVYSYS